MSLRKTIIIKKCQPTAEMGVHKMNILVGIWPCQLLERMKHPQLSWNILVAYHSCCSIKMSDSTVISAEWNVALPDSPCTPRPILTFVASECMRWASPASARVEGLERSVWGKSWGSLNWHFKNSSRMFRKIGIIHRVTEGRGEFENGPERLHGVHCNHLKRW